VSIAPHVVRFGAALLDFVYPPHCPVCDVWQPPDDREPVCRVYINSLLATIGPCCDRCSAPLKAPSSSGSYCPNCCLGNSFTHLFKERDRCKALAEFYAVCAYDGLLVLDQRNHDSILDDGYSTDHAYHYCGESVKV
jgi:hypothetical protein